MPLRKYHITSFFTIVLHCGIYIRNFPSEIPQITAVIFKRKPKPPTFGKGPKSDETKTDTKKKKKNTKKYKKIQKQTNKQKTIAYNFVSRDYQVLYNHKIF